MVCWPRHAWWNVWWSQRASRKLQTILDMNQCTRLPPHRWSCDSKLESHITRLQRPIIQKGEKWSYWWCIDVSMGRSVEHSHPVVVDGVETAAKEEGLTSMRSFKFERGGTEKRRESPNSEVHLKSFVYKRVVDHYLKVAIQYVVYIVPLHLERH